MKTWGMKHASFALAAGVAMSAMTVPAQALTINLVDVGGVTGSPAELGFAIAAHYWETVFTNDATLTFNVGYESLGPGILGQTGSSLVTFVPISDYYDSLAANQTSALDATAVANLTPLSGTGSVEFVVPGYFNDATKSGVDNNKPSRISPDGKAISNTIAISTANDKALHGGTAGVDGEITFSSDFDFDFDPTDGIVSGGYDFIGVAIHEIGHALGFLSGTDDFNYSQGNGFPVDEYWWGYALDMFRYTDEGQLNINPGDPGYFSIDGGLTPYDASFFSTGVNYGDGRQASHWKAPGGCSNLIGIMNPYLCDGTKSIVTNNDLAAFDAIGWNLADGARDNANYAVDSAEIYRAYFATPSVPEPTTWAMMIGGLALVGATLRRSKANVRVSFV